MRMERHDDSQRSGRLAVTQPVHPTRILPPPVPFRTDKQLTAPADRRVRESAHAGAFTTAVAIAIGGAGSVHRRTGVRPPVPFPVTATVPDPRPPTHRHRTDRPRRRSTTYVARATAYDSGPPWVASPSTYDSFIHNNLAGFCRHTGGQDDTKRTARARGVSPGEPGESHAARFSRLTQTGRPRWRARPLLRA